MKKKNWRTTTVGFLGGIIVVATQVVALLDSDPNTVFSFEALTIGLAALGIGWFAKDAGVSGTEK